MDWLQARLGSISAAAAVIRALMAVGVDPFRLDGDTCPFGGAKCCAGPTCVHAVGCDKQHLRGKNPTHTQQKRAMQRMLLQHHAGWFTNEDSSPFTVPGKTMDTVVAPGALSLAAAEEFALKGVLVDTTIRTPTVARYMDPVKGAADVSGFATKKAERDKELTYKGMFDADRWILVTFAQESFGRFGEQALGFVGVLASHSAACRGGDAEVIKRRTGIIRRSILTEFSVCLAKELGERVLAYVRGAIMAGRSADPVSALLRR